MAVIWWKVRRWWHYPAMITASNDGNPIYHLRSWWYWTAMRWDQLIRKRDRPRNWKWTFSYPRVTLSAWWKALLAVYYQGRVYSSCACQSSMLPRQYWWRHIWTIKVCDWMEEKARYHEYEWRNDDRP